MVRALAMISGGLDSILAAKLIKDQGIEVIGLCFKSYFFSEESAMRMVKQIDIPLVVVDFSNEHFDMVKNPKHGRGKNMNPCIDCHAMMMKYAGEMLEEYKADFIITGEVLNQRPMSQNRQALNVVKKESGFGHKILRPLCAKNLDPTEMELSGLVDRDKLMDIMGRSRKVQMELASKWGIAEYPSPAGGCRLTEPNYALRLRDLLEFNECPSDQELELLRHGRHFRTGDNNKIIVARTKEDGDNIKVNIGEGCYLFHTANHSGALVVLSNYGTEEDRNLAAKIAARYSKGRECEKLSVKYGKYGNKLNEFIDVKPISDEELQQYLVTIK